MPENEHDIAQVPQPDAVVVGKEAGAQLTITVLQPAELAYISEAEAEAEAEDKARARRDLAAALAASPTRHLSAPRRPFVIPR